MRIPSCSTAIVLSGGARDFHMTALSLVDNLAIPLGLTDVCWFIRALLDPDAHKLTALLHAEYIKVVSLQVDSAPMPASLRAQSRRVLIESQADRAAQEMLLLEQAQAWVNTFEAMRGIPFQLVVRARMDSFWSAPISLHTVAQVAQNVYIVPRGKSFRGVNDRFGLSDSNTARIAHRRSTDMFSYIAANRTAQMNSELYTRWALTMRAIKPLEARGLRFCLLVKRKSRCCMSVPRCSIPGGNRCRPCTTDEHALQVKNSSGAEVNSLGAEWPQNVSQAFDTFVPERYSRARHHIETRSEAECVQDIRRLARITWIQPVVASPYAICRLANAVNCTFNIQSGKWLGGGCNATSPASSDYDANESLMAKPTCRKSNKLDVCAQSGGRDPWWRRVSAKNRTRNPRVTAITMVKDAAPLLREWVPFHLMLGVTHMVILNNDCGEAASLYASCQVLGPFIEAGVVTLKDDDYRCLSISRVTALRTEMAKFLSKDNGINHWIIELDPDEYMVVPAVGSWVPTVDISPLGDLLRGVSENYDTITLPWRVFGTSFRKNQTSVGSIIGNYQQRVGLEMPFRALMSLLTDQLSKNQINPFLSKQIVRSRLYKNGQGACLHSAHDHSCSRNLRLGWAEHNAMFPEKYSGFRARDSRIWINHYSYLSEQDWARKKARGRPRSGKHWDPREGSVNELLSAVSDTSALDLVRHLAATAHDWSPHPHFVQRCAARLSKHDDHYVTNTPQAQGQSALDAVVDRLHGVSQTSMASKFLATQDLTRSPENLNGEALVRTPEALIANYRSLLRRRPARLPAGAASLPESVT